MDSKTRIERVKRVARLKDFWTGKGKDGVVAVVRARPTAVKAVPEENLVQIVATTERIDVDAEVVVATGFLASAKWIAQNAPKSGLLPSATDSYFLENKSVFLDHQYDMDNFIGKCRRVTPISVGGRATGWYASVRLNKDHRHAATVMDLAADGLIGSSIGFQRIEGGKPTAEEVKRYSRDGREPELVARTWEWIELSFTGMPANVDAQAVGFEEAKSAMLDELVSKGRCSRALGVSLGLPESPTRRLYPVTTPRRRVIMLDCSDKL